MIDQIKGNISCDAGSIKHINVFLSRRNKYCPKHFKIGIDTEKICEQLEVVWYAKKVLFSRILLDYDLLPSKLEMLYSSRRYNDSIHAFTVHKEFLGLLFSSDIITKLFAEMKIKIGSRSSKNDELSLPYR